MGAIRYAFPGVPDDVDLRIKLPNNPPWTDVRFQGIYTDLKELGLRLPPVPAEKITRAALVAHLQGLLGELVRAELEADPEKLYSPAHGHAEHAKAFSEHRINTANQNLEIPSRLSRVLARFPHGPNELTAADVAAARGL